MCVYIHIYIYIYIYIRICSYVNVYVLYISFYIYIYTHIHTYIQYILSRPLLSRVPAAESQITVAPELSSDLEVERPLSVASSGGHP